MTKEMNILKLVQIGLIKGANSFEPEKGYKPATYLSTCIRNEILLYIRKQNTTKRKGHTISLNKIIEEDENKNELESIISGSNNIEDYIDDEYKKYLYNKTQKIMKCLKDREIKVLNYYFGINGYEKLKQVEISEKLKISQTVVSRIIRSSINKIKNNFTKEDLKLWDQIMMS